MFRDPAHTSPTTVVANWITAIKSFIYLKTDPKPPVKWYANHQFTDIDSTVFGSLPPADTQGWISKLFNTGKGEFEYPEPWQRTVADQIFGDLPRLVPEPPPGWFTRIINFLKENPKSVATAATITATLLLIVSYRIWQVYEVVYNPRRLFPEPNVRFFDMSSYDEKKPFLGLRPDLQWLWNKRMNNYIRFLQCQNRITCNALYFAGILPADRVDWYNKVSNVRMTDLEYDVKTTELFSNENLLHNRSTLRRPFLNTPFVKQRVSTTHTHPAAAGERNSIMDFCTTFAAKTGLKVFVEQASAADQRKSIRGKRQFYWTKDFTTRPQNDEALPDDLIVMVDVDFHKNMPKMLATNTNPVLIYTIQPTQVAGKMFDTAFTFENNEICTTVAGGANFRHQLWDYGQDHFTCFDYQYDEWFATTYLVERKTLDHRTIVLLEPVAHHRGLPAQITIMSLTMKTLERFRPQPDGHSMNLITSFTPEGHFVSIGQPGSYRQVTISQQTYGALRAVAAITQTKITAATVESYLPKEDPESRGDAQILVNHLREYVKPTVHVNVVNESIVHYTANPRKYDPDSKKKASALWSPIISIKATAPTSCYENDVRCVEARITGIKHNAPLKMNTFLQNVINEFVDNMVPIHKQSSLLPVSVATVYKNQSRPTQQRTLDLACTIGPNGKTSVTAFQKNEVGGKYSDPRNISTIPPKTKLAYSQFYYSMSAYLKTLPWYTFGKTPRAVSEKVASICSVSTSMAAGDFSRMDARVSNIGRMITESVMLALFPKYLHEELIDLMKLQTYATCYTTHGVKYNSGTTRLSGSPETSGNNTMENAFVAYLAYRKTRRPDTGAFYSKEEAWEMLASRCEFGGDDSLMGDMVPASYAAAAKDIGHIVKCDVFNRGDPGVNFLSRIFGPDVWYGDPNNMCDLLRQLTKFHTSTVTTANPASKFTEKAISNMFTDPNTPILGRYIRLWLELNNIKIPKKIVDPGVDTSWWSANFQMSEQFINKEADWMFDVAEKQIPGFNWGLFMSWQPKTPEEMLNAPSFSEPVEIAHPDFNLVADFGNGNAHAIYAKDPTDAPIPSPPPGDHTEPSPDSSSRPQPSKPLQHDWSTRSWERTPADSSETETDDDCFVFKDDPSRKPNSCFFPFSDDGRQTAGLGSAARIYSARNTAGVSRSIASSQPILNYDEKQEKDEKDNTSRTMESKRQTRPIMRIFPTSARQNNTTIGSKSVKRTHVQRKVKRKVPIRPAGANTIYPPPASQTVHAKDESKYSGSIERASAGVSG
jgi:hypothetical protein